jgi:hypothetical protein
VLDERRRRSGNLARRRRLVDDSNGQQFRWRALGTAAAATGTTRTHPEPWRLRT